MAQRKITLAEAQRLYINRFTLEHVPTWATKQRPSGTYPAPQYASDAEWYANSIFPGEPGVHGNRKHCESYDQTWPLGISLDAPYVIGQHLAEAA